MSVAFSKYEGLGNDFVVVDAPDGALLPLEVRVALCDRHRGVGADGVLTVLPPSTPGAVAAMHITNPDGSVPEMCGNGLRCVSLFLVHERRVAVGQDHVVDTGAGRRTATVLDDVDASAGEARVRVDMGPARFDVPAQFPAWFRARGVLTGVTDELGAPASTVSMGNPHLVLEAEPDVVVAGRVGPVLERAAAFPERTNVELAAVRGDGSVDVVVWERGAGLTQACGTGACGVVAVLARAGRVPFDADVTVRLPGGPLTVRVPALPPGATSTGPVWMTGPARRVFTGVFAPRPAAQRA